MKNWKRILTAGTLLALVAALPISANRGLSFGAEYGTPVVDGKIDAVWSACTTSAVVNLPHNGNNKGSSDTATVKAMWDETGIVFLVEAKDSQLAENEVFEFYLDEIYDKQEAYNKNDRQTRVYVESGEKLSNNNRTDIDGADIGRGELYRGAAFAKTADGWILEASFKWSDTADIKAGKTIGAEFLWDDQGAGLYLRWNVDTAAGDVGPFKSTTDFGALTLNAPAPAAEPEKTPDTADPAAIAALSAALAGAVLAVSKKRK